MFALCAIVIGCSNRDPEDTQKELSKEQKITEKVEEQKEELMFQKFNWSYRINTHGFIIMIIYMCMMGMETT